MSIEEAMLQQQPPESCIKEARPRWQSVQSALHHEALHIYLGRVAPRSLRGVGGLLSGGQPALSREPKSGRVMPRRPANRGNSRGGGRESMPTGIHSAFHLTGDPTILAHWAGAGME